MCTSVELYKTPIICHDSQYDGQILQDSEEDYKHRSQLSAGLEEGYASFDLTVPSVP